jgi:hypothetical protein
MEGGRKKEGRRQGGKTGRREYEKERDGEIKKEGMREGEGAGQKNGGMKEGGEERRRKL